MGFFVNLTPETIMIIIGACALIIVVMVIGIVSSFIKKRNSKHKWKKLLNEGKITEAEYQTAIDNLGKKN